MHDEIVKSEVNLCKYTCTTYIFITKFAVSLRIFRHFERDDSV